MPVAVESENLEKRIVQELVKQYSLGSQQTWEGNRIETERITNDRARLIIQLVGEVSNAVRHRKDFRG